MKKSQGRRPALSIRRSCYTFKLSVTGKTLCVVLTQKVKYLRQSRRLENVDRSKRLQTIGHLKVAAIPEHAVGQASGLRPPAS
jgi:mRNA-degrading endonuclease toxin of MazEF toxin-antitoxin module